MKSVLVIFLGLSTLSTFASVRYECETPIVSDRAVYSAGTLIFTDNILGDGKRVLTNIMAEIRADWEQLPDDECVTEYCGEFQIDRLEENMNYKPRIYKDHSQFLGFNAQSSADGMWGRLVVEKKTGEAKMKAHYIFQAGDHIGGVIDFNCQRVD